MITAGIGVGRRGSSLGGTIYSSPTWKVDSKEWRINRVRRKCVKSVGLDVGWLKRHQTLLPYSCPFQKNTQHKGLYSSHETTVGFRGRSWAKVQRAKLQKIFQVDPTVKLYAHRRIKTTNDHREFMWELESEVRFNAIFNLKWTILKEKYKVN